MVLATFATDIKVGCKFAEVAQGTSIDMGRCGLLWFDVVALWQLRAPRSTTKTTPRPQRPKFALYGPASPRGPVACADRKSGARRVLAGQSALRRPEGA